MFISQFDDIDNKSLFTPYSIVHIYSSMVGYFILNFFVDNIIYKFCIALVIHTLYEFKDYYLAYIKKYKTKKEDELAYKGSYVNSIGDSIASVIGICIAIKINPYKTNKTSHYIIYNTLMIVLLCTTFNLNNLG
tara:strand:- start:43 stop:444 length:402 start_codon:yes stop_codon:yes gene_type:complete